MRRLRAAWRAMVKFVKESLLGCVAAALMLPGLLAFTTVLFVITSKHGALPGHPVWNTALNRTPARECLYGALLAIGSWVLLGVAVGRRYSKADSACPGPFDELCRRTDRAKKRLADIQSSPVSAGLRAEAEKHLKHLNKLLETPSQPGLRWLLGTGYLDAWRRLHAVEETLLFLEPDDALLVGAAFSDEGRLEGSSLPQREDFLSRLRLAVFSVSETAACYLRKQPLHEEKECVRAKAPNPQEARSALAQVRSAIDDFRDNRREGIVRARNRLFATVVFAGITGCVLLYIAILDDAPKRSIVAVTVFYLVGAMVGLFRQLQIASSSAGAGQEDYELGIVRLIFTPQFSGLAAVGGVVLVKLTQAQGKVALSTTFNLHSNTYGLVAAAIFGLTPTLLFSGLQNRIDQYQSDLSKSNAGQAPAAPSGD